MQPGIRLAISLSFSLWRHSTSMVIVLFLIDTSPSMYQRTYLGPSLLDVAKTSVDTFSKVM